MSQHDDSEAGPSSFRCQICDHVSEYKEDFDTHICLYSDRSYSDRSEIGRSYQTQNNQTQAGHNSSFECQICYFNTRSEEAYKNHTCLKSSESQSHSSNSDDVKNKIKSSESHSFGNTNSDEVKKKILYACAKCKYKTSMKFQYEKHKCGRKLVNFRKSAFKNKISSEYTLNESKTTCFFTFFQEIR